VELPGAVLPVQILVALHAQGFGQCLQVEYLNNFISFNNKKTFMSLKSSISLYSPLFGETRKEYIRNFAAESFAFIMRKVIIGLLEFSLIGTST
jgi:diphthamide synthase (EF-2-diphthine--ammonia ligase)